MRKNIDLPNDSIKVLEYLAKQDGRSVKNYIERVLIGHANDNESLLPKKNSKSKK